MHTIGSTRNLHTNEDARVFGVTVARSNEKTKWHICKRLIAATLQDSVYRPKIQHILRPNFGTGPLVSTALIRLEWK